MNKGLLIALAVIGVVLLIGASIAGWGISVYNKIVSCDQAVHAGWSQVQNQYQRRYDLIPNLVETVKGYAKQEKEVLIGVTEARASVGQMKVTPEVLRDPQAFAHFQQAQDGLGSALSRLMVVMEKYPELKSNENFLDLQAQLEGTENRIAVARMGFNENVEAYNNMILHFPGSLVAGFGGYREAQYFQSTAGAEKAPQVKF
ncbi:MAG: LemA family protein [Bacteroidota bacterium]